MNIDERILRLGELIDAMPIQKSPTRMAFEANYEKIEGSLAKGNSMESICILPGAHKYGHLCYKTTKSR